MNQMWVENILLGLCNTLLGFIRSFYPILPGRKLGYDADSNSLKFGLKSDYKVPPGYLS